MQATRDAKWLDVGFVFGLAVLGMVVGAVGAHEPRLAVTISVGAAYVGFSAVRPILAAVIAVPGLYAFQSVGIGGGLGVTDTLLVGAALLSLPALAHSAELRSLGFLNRAFAVYVVLLVPSVVAHPTAEAFRELVHRFILVICAALIGAWLVHEGAVALALRLLIIVSCALSVLAIRESILSGFRAAEPYGYHKNYLGSLFALTLIIALAASAQVGIADRWRLPVIVLLIAGTVACQSRGAVLGAAAGGLIWLFAPRESFGLNSGRKRVAAFLLAASFTAYASYSVQQQLTAQDSNTNSAGVRVNVEQFTRNLWRSSPLTGVGIRYFNTHDYGPLGQDPNNVIDAELAEAGVLGTAGFVVLHVACLGALWRQRRSPIGVTALAVTVAQLLHGQFDIYWGSGISPLPFVLVGVASAATARAGAKP